MRILLVIDIQPCFKVEPYYSQVLDYIKCHRDKYDKIIATRFIPKQDSVRSQVKNLTKYNKREQLEFEYDTLIGKSTCEIGVKNYKKLLEGNEVYIIGCDTDACVLATCFQLADNNIPFKVIREFCYSTWGKEYHEAGIKVLEKNFGKKVFG